MMRSEVSPLARAASTNSRRRIETVRARSTRDAQAKGDLGVGSKPTAQATPAAFSPQCLLGVVIYRGATCSYAFPWEEQLRRHLSDSRFCFPFIELHMLAPFLSHARVQCNVHQVGQEVGSQHCHGNDEKDALQQGVVRVLDCL